MTVCGDHSVMLEASFHTREKGCHLQSVLFLEQITPDITKTCGRLPSKTKQNPKRSVPTLRNLPRVEQSQVLGISIIIERPTRHGNSS